VWLIEYISLSLSLSLSLARSLSRSLSLCVCVCARVCVCMEYWSTPCAYVEKLSSCECVGVREHVHVCVHMCVCTCSCTRAHTHPPTNATHDHTQRRTHIPLPPLPPQRHTPCRQYTGEHSSVGAGSSPQTCAPGSAPVVCALAGCVRVLYMSVCESKRWMC